MLLHMSLSTTWDFVLRKWHEGWRSLHIICPVWSVISMVEWEDNRPSNLKNLIILTLFEIMNNNCVVTTIRDDALTVSPKASHPNLVPNELKIRNNENKVSLGIGV